MKFEYKTDAELTEMTAGQRDAYAADKRKHEHDLMINTAKEQAKSIAEAMKADISKNAFSEDSEEFKAMKSKLEAIDKSIEDLGRKRETQIAGLKKKVGAIYQEQYKKIESGEYEPDEITTARNAKMKIETKAFDSLNVHSVDSVSAANYPTNGTVSAMGEDYRSIYAQILGIFDVKRVYSKIMDVVDISPLIADKIIAFNTTIVDGFAVTPELQEYPVSRESLATQSAEAKAVGSLYYTTLQMRKFYPSLVNEFSKTFRKLLQEAIPNHVMSEVRTNASAYVDLANLEWSEPGDFEAIVAMATSLKKLGYNPNMVALSPIAYAKLVTATDSTGAYKLQNGSSIILVDGTIKIGAYNLLIVEDPYLDDDEVLVGDTLEAVKVALDSAVFYFETDGVSTNQNAAGTKPATGITVGARTHQLVQFVAVLMPDAVKGSLIRDTFSNVKTLITSV